MPEGHTIRRLANLEKRLLVGRTVAVSSPQGRFAEGAALLDGHVVGRVDAIGKHLLTYFRGAPTLHIHLGLYGKMNSGTGVPPEPRGALRLRIETDEAWMDLRGATACELMDPPDIAALLGRLGPDPLRNDADPYRAWQRISRSKIAIGALLMDQKVLAGVGNVYRAELLFRHRVDPFLAGLALRLEVWQEMWLDLQTLMRAGVRTGRIETVRDEDRVPGRLRKGDRSYVYRRQGLPCRVCGTEIRTEVMVGRNLFWCPYCQALGSGGTIA